MATTFDQIESHSMSPHSECALCGHDYPFRLPPAIVDAASHGRLVLFAGGGISTERPGCFPNSFYEEMKSVLSSPAEDSSFPSIMTGYESEYGRLSLIEELMKRISYARSFPSLRLMVTRFHHELATITQIREVITTNWDDYFERFCEMQPIVTDRDYAFYNLPGRKVYKIHGSINNVSTIVATLDDYKRCEDRLKTSVIGGTLRHLLGTKIVVFVGYSLKDEDFKNVYGPLIESMDDLRPVTYIVSPFDVPDAEEFKLRHIKTDGSSFLKSLKEHLIKLGENLPDEVFERIESLRAIAAKAHAGTSDMDWRSHPELVYSLAYQDGMIDGFGKIMTQFETGEYSYIPHIRHTVRSYEELLQTAIEKRRYWDAAYIDGYQNALISLLLESDEVSRLPLYEIFDEDDFPPEVDDNSWQSSNDTDEEGEIEAGHGEDNEEVVGEEETEDEQPPDTHSQDELLDILAGMEEKYPKLFEEANRIVSSIPEPLVPQHTAFLDGVIGEYKPPSIS